MKQLPVPGDVVYPKNRAGSVVYLILATKKVNNEDNIQVCIMWHSRESTEICQPWIWCIGNLLQNYGSTSDDTGSKR